MLIAFLTVVVLGPFTPVHGQESEIDFTQWTDAQKEAFLTEADVIRTFRIGTGVTEPRRVALCMPEGCRDDDGDEDEKGDIRHEGHFQDVEIQDVGTRIMANGTRVINFRDNYEFNIAAYRIDRLINLNMVPVSIKRRVSGDNGALTWWVDNTMMTETERRNDGLRAPDALTWSDHYRTAMVFTELVGNSDPNTGNFLIDEDWNLWCLDFTRAFRATEELMETRRLGARLSRKVYEGLQALNMEMLEEATDGLNFYGDQLEALLVRRDLILEYYDGQIEMYSEDEVLWDTPGQMP